MSKFTNFEMLMENMINPLDNPEFYGLILGDDRWRNNGAFSLCHDFDLGCTTIENYHGLLALALEKFVENTSEEEFKKKFKYNGNYKKLQEYFKKIINANDKHRALIKFASHKPNESLVKKGLQLGEQISDGKINNGGWIYFKSHALNPKLCENHIHSADVRHRLYITMDADGRPEMARKIIEECEQRGIPYNFKIYKNFHGKKSNQQSDTMVIYLATEEQVVEYANFIDEIIQESPNLKNHIHSPSPHLGIVSQYLGYGFEPKLENGKTSYSKMLKEAVINIGLEERREIAINTITPLTDNKKWGHMISYSPNIESSLLPSEMWKIKLENPQYYREIIQLLQKGDKTPEESEKVRNALSTYYRRCENDLEEIQKLRELLVESIIRVYPQLPADNMFGIEEWDLDLYSTIGGVKASDFSQARQKIIDDMQQMNEQGLEMEK